MAEAKKFDTSMSVWGKLANLPDLAKAYLFQVRFFYDTESPLAHRCCGSSHQDWRNP